MKSKRDREKAQQQRYVFKSFLSNYPLASGLVIRGGIQNEVVTSRANFNHCAMLLDAQISGILATT